MSANENDKKTLSAFILQDDLVRMKLANWCKYHLDFIASSQKADALPFSTQEYTSFFETPPEEGNADLALPCFRFAKNLKQKPDQIAQTLANADFSELDCIKSIHAVGAFLNIKLNPVFLAENLAKEILCKNNTMQSKFDSASSFANKSEKLNNEIDIPFFNKFKLTSLNANTRVMIEHSQPNTHKEFHVGHTRNVCLGDSLVRLYRYCSFPVIAANYPGDEGAHIAKCLWFIFKEKTTPEANEDKGLWLGQMYVQATKLLNSLEGENLETAQKEISQILAAIESKAGEIYEYWKKSREWSLESFYKIYDLLDVKFDHYFFESELSEASQQIVDEYYSKNLFVLDDGAIGIDLKDYKLGFLLLRKRDGNTLYATKDLVLARRKFQDFNIDKSIYVVAQEQSMHFKQVFKTLELMGFSQAKNCFHLSYGLVVLPEGKMSSREGNTISFNQLYDAIYESIDEHMQKYSTQWQDGEKEFVLRSLTVSAIKYGMLYSDPVKNVVFKLEDWVSFEGKSGPYLLYTYARCSSILRKAYDLADCKEFLRTPFSAKNHMQAITSEAEANLLCKIWDFNLIVAKTCEQNKPSLLGQYAYELAQIFNRMYAQVSILSEKEIETKIQRLRVLQMFSLVMEKSLGLLGIPVVDRM